MRARQQRLTTVELTARVAAPSALMAVTSYISMDAPKMPLSGWRSRRLKALSAPLLASALNTAWMVGLLGRDTHLGAPPGTTGRQKSAPAPWQQSPSWAHRLDLGLQLQAQRAGGRVTAGRHWRWVAWRSQLAAPHALACACLPTHAGGHGGASKLLLATCADHSPAVFCARAATVHVRPQSRAVGRQNTTSSCGRGGGAGALGGGSGEHGPPGLCTGPAAGPAATPRRSSAARLRSCTCLVVMVRGWAPGELKASSYA